MVAQLVGDCVDPLDGYPSSGDREYAVTLLPYTKMAPMVQCAMGAIFVVMHVYCTYFNYSHSTFNSFTPLMPSYMEFMQFALVIPISA